MDMVFVFVFALFCVAGLYFIGAALYWRVVTFPVRGEIAGFQEKRSKLRRLPIVKFHDRDENAIKAHVQSIDHFGYIISGAYEGDVIPLRHHKKNAKRVRMSGYFTTVIGLLLQIPMILFLAGTYMQSFAQSQIAFLIVFLLILGLAWIMLRWIRVNY